MNCRVQVSIQVLEMKNMFCYYISTKSLSIVNSCKFDLYMCFFFYKVENFQIKIKPLVADFALNVIR